MFLTTIDLNTLSSIKPPMVMEIVFPVIAQIRRAIIVAVISHETYIFTPAIKYSLSENASIFIIATMYLLWAGFIDQEPAEYAMAYLPSADV